MSPLTASDWDGLEPRVGLAHGLALVSGTGSHRVIALAFIAGFIAGMLFMAWWLGALDEDRTA